MIVNCTFHIISRTTYHSLKLRSHIALTDVGPFFLVSPSDFPRASIEIRQARIVSSVLFVFIVSPWTDVTHDKEHVACRMTQCLILLPQSTLYKMNTVKVVKLYKIAYWTWG